MYVIIMYVMDSILLGKCNVCNHNACYGFYLIIILGKCNVCNHNVCYGFYLISAVHPAGVIAGVAHLGTHITQRQNKRSKH